MPSLVRFLVLIALLVGATWGTLYALSEYGEPSQREVKSSVSGVKVRR